MDLLNAIIMSFVEGITEFLPISSTGHLILTADLLKIPQTDFVKSFEIIIQLGAILAVIITYRKELISSVEIWKKILFAFIPTAIIGFIFYKLIKNYLLGNTIVVLISLFIGGILLIVLEYLYKKEEHTIDKIEKISYKHAFFIGLVQSISIIPGMSRSAASIFGGMITNLKRETAVEFSFLLAIPTIIGATALDVAKNGHSFSSNELYLLLVGFIGSFLFAFMAVKFFLHYIKRNTFIPFGIYRIVLAVVFWLIIAR